MVCSRHGDFRSKVAGGVGDVAIVGSDDHAAQISAFPAPFPDVLDHGFTGKDGEGFSGESGGCVSGWNNSQNRGAHNRE
jgi:hypothetical protein